MRKLVWTLLSLMLWLPLAAQGVGLGEIRLNSALNQPLDAEIDLLSVEERELDTMRADLASYEVFAQMGLDRPSSLIFLNFEVMAKDGGHIIKVTSTKPIREPFLDFLIELNWRAGRLLREYTLLLDPPEVSEKTAPQVQAPAVTVVPAAAPAVESQGAMLPGTQAAPSGALEYGPVKSTDTLWGIARQLRGSHPASVQQVMMALYTNNPHAFDGNINVLKKGAVLRIDDPAQLRAMSRRQAAAEVASQTREWEEHRIKAAAAAGQRRTGAGIAPTAPSGVAAPEKPHLKLSSPEGEKAQAATAAGTGEGMEQLRRDLMLAMEESEVRRRENEELQGRMKALEEQLATMQQLLSLKDQDLAALQQQLRQQGMGVEGEVEPQPMAEAPAAVEEPTVPADEAPMVAEPAKPVVPKPMPKPVPQPVEPPSFVDDVFALLGDNTMAVGGFAGILALLLGLIIYRRRKGSDFQESILSGGSSSLMRASEEENASTETSFFSDLASGATGGAEESEVDPLTEADVYMAYGRNQQAEELLKEAIEANPGRVELRVKLQELYYKTKNPAAFAAAAVATHEALDGSGPLWEKVMVMGHELCPDNDLFAAAPEGVSLESEAAAESPLAEEEVLDIGLDLDELAKEMESTSAEEELDLDLGIDFGDLEGIDLGAEEEPAAEEGGVVEEVAAAEEGPATEETAAAEEGAGEELDFGLDNLDFGALDQAEPEAEEAEAVAEAPAEEAVAEEAPAEEEKGEGEGLDFDLGDFSFGAEAEEETPAEAEVAESEEGAGLDLDLGGMDFGAESEEEAPAEEVVEHENLMDFDVSGLNLGESEAEEEVPAEEPAVEFELPELEEGGEAAASEEKTPVVEEAVVEESAGEADSGLDFDLSELDNLGQEGDDLDFASEQLMEPEEGAAGAETEDDELLDLDDDLLGGLDEIATKLDLAKAYVDMGDAESARGMLEEVMSAGNDEQKQQAEELLAQLQG